MSKLDIGNSEIRSQIEEELLSVLREQSNFMTSRTINSPRAVGDAVEEIISQNFESVLGDMIGEYSASFARRAMADLAFTDNADNYYVVDVKTHRTDTKFNMPNLTSVERLSRFYEDDKNHFLLLKIDYGIESDSVCFENITFVAIEQLSWSCLTIGALGWGQIQIANASKVELTETLNRKQWMIELCDTLLAFYPKEIGKINDRILHFERIKNTWLAR